MHRIPHMSELGTLVRGEGPVVWTAPALVSLPT